MTTSIKVDDETKHKIEQLRAQLLLNTGQKITQQQLVGLLTEWGMNNLEIIEQVVLDQPTILSEDERNAYQKVRKPTGVSTSSREIDKFIYGD